MAFTQPAISDFKNQFQRDFPYVGTIGDPTKGVTDFDINVGITRASYSININMWPDQTSYNLAFLYLAAHYMVLNIRNSSQGFAGQFNWAQNSKAVNGVSEGFQIPDRISNNPFFMTFTKTNYGAMYLEMCLPQLAGAVYTAPGGGNQFT